MSIGEKKNQPVSNDRFAVKKNDLDSYYVRCSAGSDNCGNADRNCGRRNSQQASCPCRPEQPSRRDRQSDPFPGSGLSDSNRQGPMTERISRNRRGTYDVQLPPCGDQNAQRCGYDVEPEPQNSRRGTYDVPRPCAALQQNDRRGTYNVSQPCAAVQQNDRRGTYNVSQPCPAVQQNDRRGTYNVPQPCAAPQRNSDVPRLARSSNYGGFGAGNMTGSFALTGTFQLDGFQGPSSGQQPPRDRSSAFSRQHDTDGNIDDFLDNHLDYDMVAPRSVALPGQPYVNIDESAANTTPEHWRLTLGNRSSMGSQGLGNLSPTYDDYNRGSPDTSADSSRRLRRRRSSADRQSSPFGIDDSFAMNGRQSRARSANPQCGLPSSNNRRDTFDRNTQ